MVCCVITGCVDNVQIIPRPSNLDGQHSKNALPVLGTFKRTVQSVTETNHSSQQSDGDDGVPVTISHIQPSVMFCCVPHLVYLLL